MSSARLNRTPRSNSAPGVEGITHPKHIMTHSGLKAPFISKELLQHLGLVFPLKSSREMSLRDYDYIQGHQEVIRYLQSLHEQQMSE